jgi:hypothetical protein
MYLILPQEVFLMKLYYNSVLVRLSIPAQNIMTKKQVGEERVYSGLELKQVRRQELMQRP